MTTTTKTRNLIVTRADVDRLTELIRETRKNKTEGHEYVDALERELGNATVVASEDVPPDVVTMNSTVVIRVEGSRRSLSWTVVYPQDANIDEDRISVLAPLGTALLGYRAGDTLEWTVPAGTRKYHILKILHQPEAAGEFDR